MRVAINGFGRIGRVIFKRALEEGVNIVAVNDRSSVETLAHLLKYDTIYGVYDKKIEAGKGFIMVGNKKIIFTSNDNPEQLPWEELKVDVVVECTGVFRDREGASKHLKAGAKKVLISASAKEPDFTIVPGVNDKDLKPSHKIISMASCTTNCIAPIIKVLDDKFGIQKGYLTTVHAYTNDQVILDAHHKDFRRARAGAVNIIPTTSGAAKAVETVIPKLKGKIDGMALRVPVACGSITDFVCTVKKSATVEAVNKAIKDAAKNRPKVFEYTEDEIVSSDIIGNPHSTIFDSKLTKTNGNMIKVLSWYDNEFGYSCRMVDVVKRL
ncbi:MAG: type I glyceraldehyde-3-phosphate dehydrogenase [Nanoarchaeota archaeon]|nr:type I glyceraldehyde-3-phosphate dehydrogenase [Nanoarchaeota archaeon]